jgi:G:T-mismatch repair DNA endonuclease (very short patch repair protein)
MERVGDSKTQNGNKYGILASKAKRNIAKDKIVNEALLKNGWKVIRFWGKDIKKNLEICLRLNRT